MSNNIKAHSIEEMTQDSMIIDTQKNNKGRIHTKVSEKTKIRWNNFLLAHHDTIKGSFGPELERAMNQYMDNFVSVSTETGKKINKSTLKTLQLISSGFRDLPTFPLTKPMIITATIKNYCQYSDSRTVSKYRKMVLQHSKELSIPDDMFPQLDVEGFCEYVDRLSNQSHLK